jgi:hypothetical protein
MFKELNKNEVVEKAYLVFLNELPLCEIDNQDVRLTCKKYRDGSLCLLKCQNLLKKHFNYFYNWAYSNWMTNVFYNSKK